MANKQIVPTGPFQALVKAQQSFHQALQQGTTAEIQDAQHQLDQARQKIQAVQGKKLNVSGPFSRLLRARQTFALALQHGTQAQVTDAQLQLQQAEKQVQKLGQQGSTFGQRFLKFAASSRFGVSSAGHFSVMPLVGQLGNLVGGEGGGGAAAGAAGGAAMAAIAVAVATLKFQLSIIALQFKLFGEVIRTATDAAKEFGEQRLTTGGNSGNIAFLRTLGVDPGGASALRNNLATNPMAMAAARQIGIGPVLPKIVAPGLNEAQLQQNLIKKIAGQGDDSAKGEQQRFALAQRLDAASLMPQIELYRRHRAAVDADTAVMESIADPQMQKDAADLAFSFDRLRQNFVGIIMALGKPFLKDFADFIGRVADKARDAANWLNQNQAALVQFKDALKGMAVAVIDTFRMIGMQIAVFGRSLFKFTGGKAGADAFDLGKGIVTGADALKKLLMGSGNAHQKAADTMQDAAGKFASAVAQGTHGGGDRARGAMPSAMKGYAFQRAVEGSALRLGAFAL